MRPEAADLFAAVREGADVKLASILGAISVFGVAACGGSSPHSCVTVPETIPDTSLLTNGTQLTVRVSAIVYVELVESASYPAGPGFPWLTPRSSDPSVLAPVHLCTRTGASSLALTVTGFRAIHPGTATLNAPLTPRWRSIRTKPPRFLSSVTVLR
jgi:hypothetical protein